MPEDPPDSRELGYYFALAQVGVEMVAPLGIGLGLDFYFGWLPWATVTGAVLGFVGAGYAIVRRVKPLILVASFPIGYGIFISAFIVRNDRTIMPLLPFLYILAAALIVQAVQWAANRGFERRAALAGGALLMALLAIGHAKGQDKFYGGRFDMAHTVFGEEFGKPLK